MVQIAVAPFVLKDVVFKAAADDFAKHLSSVQFVPSTTAVTWTGLGKNTFSDSSAPTWVCNISYAQDWDTENSFSQWLEDHAGEAIEVVFQPKAGSGQSTRTATLNIVAGPIGGDVNAVQSGTVSLGVDGAPVRGTSA